LRPLPVIASTAILSLGAGLLTADLRADPVIPVEALGKAQTAALTAVPVPAEIPIALLVDMSSGQVLFAREPDRRFIPASVTKVMTAYTAFQLVESGDLPLERPFLVSQQLEDEWSGEGSSMFLKAGDRPTIDQLLMGATTVSGNDASVALAMASTGTLDGWLKLMNANARELGMKNTHFGSPNGFPDGGTTYTSAADLVQLASAIIRDYPAYYGRYFGNHGFRWNNITQANHDPLTGKVEGADGLKTGFTNEAGYTFVGSAEREGRRLIVVIAGSPTARERDKAARELIEWGFAEFAPARLLAEGQPVSNATVQLGAEDSVALVADHDVMASLPASSSMPIHAHVTYRGPVTAPIAAGQEIATLHVTIGDQPGFEVPLVAERDVAKAGLLRRIAAGLSGLTS